MRFNGIVNGMNDLTRLSAARTRSISPENFTGAPGKGGMCRLEDGAARLAARDLGVGWKVNPYIFIEAGETFEIANIEGPGVIQHIWMTPTGSWRNVILRMYWDGQAHPSVECPVGDFFASTWNRYAQLSSLAVCVNHTRKYRSGTCNLLLPDRLHTHRGSRGLRLFPRAVSSCQPTPLQICLYSSRQCAGTRTLRRHLHGLGCQQLRLVG